MARLLRIVSKVPVIWEFQLAWQRSLLDRAYVRDIAAAQKTNDRESIESLEHGHWFELSMHDEEEDHFLTQSLISKARRLRVSLPHRTTDEDVDTGNWYRGEATGRHMLSTAGMALLREEIRKELRARHELRAHWTVWLSAFTGLVGAITGLVAVLQK